jgi:hypothetical protein
VAGGAHPASHTFEETVDEMLRMRVFANFRGQQSDFLARRLEEPDFSAAATDNSRRRQRVTAVAASADVNSRRDHSFWRRVGPAIASEQASPSPSFDLGLFGAGLTSKAGGRGCGIGSLP